MASDRKFKLYYFNGRGRAETVRYLFSYVQQPFEDYRLEREEWPSVKPKSPVGQVPFIEITEADGKKWSLCQSHTIVRVLGDWFNLTGKTASDKARTDEAYEILHDIQDTMVKAIYEKDEERKKKVFDSLKNDCIPRNLGFLEKRAKDNGGKSISGAISLTYADLFLATLLESFELGATEVGYETFETNYPTLIAIKKAVVENSGIKEYLAHRPTTPF